MILEDELGGIAIGDLYAVCLDGINVLGVDCQADYQETGKDYKVFHYLPV